MATTISFVIKHPSSFVPGKPIPTKESSEGHTNQQAETLILAACNSSSLEEAVSPAVDMSRSEHAVDLLDDPVLMNALGDGIEMGYYLDNVMYTADDPADSGPPGREKRKIPVTVLGQLGSLGFNRFVCGLVKRYIRPEGGETSSVWETHLLLSASGATGAQCDRALVVLQNGYEAFYRTRWHADDPEDWNSTRGLTVSGLRYANYRTKAERSAARGVSEPPQYTKWLSVSFEDKARGFFGDLPLLGDCVKDPTREPEDGDAYLFSAYTNVSEMVNEVWNLWSVRWYGSMSESERRPRAPHSGIGHEAYGHLGHYCGLNPSAAGLRENCVARGPCNDAADAYRTEDNRFVKVTGGVLLCLTEAGRPDPWVGGCKRKASAVSADRPQKKHPRLEYRNIIERGPGGGPLPDIVPAPGRAAETPEGAEARRAFLRSTVDALPKAE